MNGATNVARQQQTQINLQETQTGVTQPQVQKADLEKDVQDASKTSVKIDSKEQVEDLVVELNDAIAPMNTNLRFGVDTQDVFYVSVIESDTSKVIRRFPAEKAAEFLPKVKELTGMLFDTRG